MAILLQSFMGSLLQTAKISRNTQVSKNLTSHFFTLFLLWHDPTEARRTAMNQASNLLGAGPSQAKKEHKFT